MLNLRLNLVIVNARVNYPLNFNASTILVYVMVVTDHKDGWPFTVYLLPVTTK